VTLRLKRTSQLRRLCLALGKALPVSPANQSSSATAPQPPRAGRGRA
jgi:hypothetical protein